MRFWRDSRETDPGSALLRTDARMEPCFLPIEFLSLVPGEPALCVGISGGADSLALCRLLSEWSDAQGDKGPEIHAVTVDHALRPDSALEAEQVAEILSSWPKVRHTILRWEGEKPRTRILEEARRARFALLSEYCRAHGISNLFLAHHRDDQAETFLTRLAKGSGLDGLAAMGPVSTQESGLRVIRPLLDIGKSELESFCRERGVVWIEDPSNRDPRYLRPRLRAAREVLEREGLSSERLATTARRVRRAREALEVFSEKAFLACLRERTDHGLVFSLSAWRMEPEEVRLRILLKAVETLHAQEKPYGPRLERMEALADALFSDEAFRRRSLAGCLFTRDTKRDRLVIVCEKS